MFKTTNVIDNTKKMKRYVHLKNALQPRTKYDLKKQSRKPHMMTKSNPLSYACPSTDINLLFETASECNAIFVKCTLYHMRCE